MENAQEQFNRLQRVAREWTLKELIDAVRSVFEHVPGFQGVAAEHKGIQGAWAIINGQHYLVEEWPPAPPEWHSDWTTNLTATKSGTVLP